MKLQSLAVIFAIIILPISMVMSAYVQSQIDTVVLQTSYDTKLSNATYDAIKAYQLNETNSNTENIASEKIRDIEASVNTFYNTLGTSLGSSGFGEEDLKAHIPALVYTLYDGYYIYSPYRNISDEKNEINQGLKPYIYYSCHYIKGSTDVVVNYTLDNYITIYGTVKGEYVTHSGYLVDKTSINQIASYLRTENLSEINETGKEVPYRYIDSNGGKRQKVYYDKNETNSNNGWYYYTVDKKQLPVENPPDVIADNSAMLYFEKAQEFTEWVTSNLGDITVGDNVTGIKITNSNRNDKIFNVSATNDPDTTSAIFNEHRREVIKHSIQTNLNAAIASYNNISQSQGSTFNFKMPVLRETDWDKILNNVSMISFMQGLPIKNKYYMGYEIVTNTKNKEFVDPNNIYYIEGNTYHKIACENYKGNEAIGYRNIDFERKKFKNDNSYYYPHLLDSDYDCIVSSTKLLNSSLEEIIQSSDRKKVIFKTALARERYNVYRSNTFGF